MKWIELIASPGSGKSTLIDPIWPPDAIKYKQETIPKEWDSFMRHLGAMLNKTRGHREYRTGLSLVNRSVNKMTAVSLSDDPRVYIQTALGQRSLGLWRRLPIDYRFMVKTYCELMPVSLGAVTLSAPVEVIKERNRKRNKANREHMVEECEEARKLCINVLRIRGVPILDLDATRPVEENRQAILDFAEELKNGNVSNI